MISQLVSLTQVQAQLTRHFEILSVNPVVCMMTPIYWENVVELRQLISEAEELYSADLIQPIIDALVSKLKPRAMAVWRTRDCFERLLNTLIDVQETVAKFGEAEEDILLGGQGTAPMMGQLSFGVQTRRELIH